MLTRLGPSLPSQDAATPAWVGPSHQAGQGLLIRSRILASRWWAGVGGLPRCPNRSLFPGTDAWLCSVLEANFPQKPVFPRQKNWWPRGGVSVAQPSGGRSSRAEPRPDGPFVPSAQPRAWPKGLSATLERLNICPRTQGSADAKLSDLYTSHLGPRGEGRLTPLDFVPHLQITS